MFKKLLAKFKPRKLYQVGTHHKVAGTSYRRDVIASFGTLNPEYKKPKNRDMTVFEYTFPQRLMAELVPDPDNEHDKNALKVLIDGKHVGYIKAGSAKHVGNISEQYDAVTAEIYGGNRKYYDEDYCKWIKEEREFSIRLTMWSENPQ